MVKCFSEIRTESDSEFHRYIVKHTKISFKISFPVLKVLNSLFYPFFIFNFSNKIGLSSNNPCFKLCMDYMIEIIKKK